MLRVYKLGSNTRSYSPADMQILLWVVAGELMRTNFDTVNREKL